MRPLLLPCHTPRVPRPVAPHLTPPSPSSRPILSPPLKLGMTPLHVAAAYGHTPVVALLLATQGVDPLTKDRVSGAQRSAQGPACLPHTPLLCP